MIRLVTDRGLTLELPGDVPDSGSGVDRVVDGAVIFEDSFGIGVDGEGLWGENFSTVLPFESRDRIEGLGVI